MRCVVQRVSRAEVRVAGEATGSIKRGMVVLVAFAPGDGEAELAWMARKLPRLRMFNDDQGHINISLADAGGAILLVSQFTLYGDCRKGQRPSFIGSATPDHARQLYQRFGELLRQEWPDVAEGIFAASMEVDLVNDGPVTLILDRDAAVMEES